MSLPLPFPKPIRLIIVGALLGAFLVAGSTSDGLAITKEEVMTLAKLNISDEEIISAIKRDRSIFNLSVGEILELKKANVSENVIKFMLSTPKLFGQPEDARPADPTVMEPTETDDDRRAREERLRDEAQKLVEERRRAEEAQRRAYAEGVLARCRRLGDEGDYVGAVRAAQQFMEQGNFAPESDESYFSRFCIANALVNANLLQGAASQLLEIVLDGPDRPFFQTAFQQLRALRQQIDYSPPQIERLADFAGQIASFSQPFQDEFNYVLGEFFHEGAEWDSAIAFLNAVTPQAKDYAKAQYLMGFMEVQNDLFRSSVGSFQRAIVATEENNSDPAVSDLAYLALARIAYRIGDYDAAIYYYRKIPDRSYHQASSFYESTWVYFLRGDYSRALGTMHTLDSPYFNHYFHPEMWILEATAYLNYCHFDRTRLALQRFENEVLPLIPPLEAFLAKTTRPEEYYRAIISTSEGRQVYELPERLIAPVLANVEFYNLYRTIKQIESEIVRLEAEGAQLGAYGSDLLARLRGLRGDRIRQIGFTIRLVLSEVLQELQNYRIKFTELGIDLDDLEISERERQQRRIELGEEAEPEPVAETGGAIAIIGSDTWRWPFENEYWRDEIGAYRSFIRDRCAPSDGYDD